MNGTEIPSWAYKAFALIVVWFIGQVVVAFINARIRRGKWNCDERRASSLLIDQEIVSRVVNAFEAHNKNEQEMLDITRNNGKSLMDIKEAIDAHSREESEAHMQIRQIHKKIVE